MTVKRNFEHDKNFFVILFKISVNVSQMFYHFIFTENKHGVAKLIRFLKQKWLMLEVQVNEY